jgi:hypothetical protein
MNGKVVGQDMVQEKRYEDVQQTGLVRLVTIESNIRMCAAFCHQQ